MLEQKIYTQAQLAKKLMHVMAEKAGTPVPPHPRSKDRIIISGYYFNIIRRAAKRALDENSVQPIKNDGGKPFLYNAAELDIIIDKVEQEMDSNKIAAGGYVRIGFGKEEIGLLRTHIKSLRSSQ